VGQQALEDVPGDTIEGLGKVEGQTHPDPPREARFFNTEGVAPRPFFGTPMAP
jgi:hypothetical protein